MITSNLVFLKTQALSKRDHQPAQACAPHTGEKTPDEEIPDKEERDEDIPNEDEPGEEEEEEELHGDEEDPDRNEDVHDDDENVSLPIVSQYLILKVLYI